MYTNDEQKSNIPIKTFIISLLIIVFFVLLLMWLLPIPTSSNNSDNPSCKVGSTCEIQKDDLSNRIFDSNIQEIKNVAIYYFTKDKLPQNDGDVVDVSLQKMIDEKLLHRITDKNGNACDTNGSYASLTKKQEDRYQMKVNLKCDNQEEYILVNLGCYSYCPSTICERKTSGIQGYTDEEGFDPEEIAQDGYLTRTDPVCSLYVSSGDVGKNGWYIGDVTVKFKTKNATTNGASIVAYGLGNDSNADYNGNESYTVNTDGVSNVYGYVKDSDGKTSICSISVKKDVDKPSCKLVILSGTKSASGNFISDIVVGFESRVDSTGEITSYGLAEVTTSTYNNISKYTITSSGKHKIYGYVRDAAGNDATCDLTVIREANSLIPSTSPSCSLMVTNGDIGENGWYVGNVTVGFASKETTNGATITNYGIGTSETYAGNSAYTINKDGTKTVYGYVKDSSGNTATCSLSIKRDAGKPTCSLKVTSGTYSSSGIYTSDVVVGFSSKNDKTNQISSYGIGLNENYDGKSTYTIKENGITTVYGYVRDSAGNTGTCSLKIEKGNSLEYQYKKEVSDQYSDWSNWSMSSYDPSNPPQFGKTDVSEIEDLGYLQVIDYYSESFGDAFYKYKPAKVGSVEQTYCSGYSYYRDINNLSITYAIRNDSGWQYVGTEVANEPVDTLSTKYEFSRFDWSCPGCNSSPKRVWNKYVRTVSIATASNTINTNGTISNCSDIRTQSVELYDNIKTYVNYDLIRTPVYKNVYSYKQRTRSLIRKAYTDYRWSNYNDIGLLNDGYIYTGNTRTVA